MSRKALQRCAVVLNASGLVAADVGTTISVGWLSSRAAAMGFVMCSRWPPSAVPLADSSVFWVLLSLILVDQQPLPSPTRTVLMCYGSGAVAPSLELASAMYVH